MLSVIMLSALLSSCGGSAADTQKTLGTTNSVDNIMKQATSDSTSQTAAASGNALKSGLSEDDLKDLDIDLSALTTTMVYSEVYNMMSKPEDYTGKKILMKGTFAVYEGDGRNYYACVIKDATACCSQGIEFLLDGNYSYPADYPAIGTEISVVGIFDTYMEGENQYCQLIDASMA